MKRSRLFLTPCFLAAERIYEWLGRDKSHLFPSFLRKTSISDFLIPNKCDWIKAPKTPAQIHQLPLQKLRPQRPFKFKMARKEAIDTHSEKGVLNRSALEVQHCVNQKTPYVSLELVFTGGTLPSNRIFSWKLKEYFLAVRKLKSIHKQLPPLEKHHDFTALIPAPGPTKPLREEDFFKKWL